MVVILLSGRTRRGAAVRCQYGLISSGRGGPKVDTKACFWDMRLVPLAYLTLSRCTCLLKTRKTRRKQPPIQARPELTSPVYPHPSQLPNRLNSMSVQSRPPSFLSESREETPFPLSMRPPPATDDPLGDRALPEPTDPEDGTLVCALLAVADDFLLGNARRYHPPVYVRAISWYTGAGGGAAAAAACGAVGASIQPTVHFSSSARSGFASRAAACCVREMCADCVGMRNCA